MINIRQVVGSNRDNILCIVGYRDCSNDRGDYWVESISESCNTILNKNFDYLFNEIQSIKTENEKLIAENNALKMELNNSKNGQNVKLEKLMNDVKSLNNNYSTFVEKEKVNSEQMSKIVLSLDETNILIETNNNNNTKMLEFVNIMEKEIPKLTLKVEAHNKTIEFIEEQIPKLKSIESS